MTFTVRFQGVSNKDNFKGKCLIHSKLDFLTLVNIITKEVLYLRWNECHLRAYIETLMTFLQTS